MCIASLLDLLSLSLRTVSSIKLKIYAVVYALSYTCPPAMAGPPLGLTRGLGNEAFRNRARGSSWLAMQNQMFASQERSTVCLLII
ncbi:hypothetical protein BC826DRAFT_694276 [Russula brevipes]|nr:hypothetical protein BC826DRAFT_694276 [Russula brevipes]